MNIFAKRFDRLFDRALLALIAVYQRRISPRKGWRCAYSRLHGGSGCSGFAREHIEDRGFQAALPAMRERFRACKAAAHTLRAQSSLETPPSERKTNSPSSNTSNCWLDPDCCLCLDVGTSCGPEALGACDAGACHFEACHCFGCF